MTDGRFTQQDAIVLGAGTPAIDFTQQDAIVLGAGSPAIDFTQQVAIAFGNFSPDVRINQQVAVVMGHGCDEVTTMCWCWKVIPISGTPRYFTTCDRDVNFQQTNYKTLSSLTPSAVQTTIGQSSGSVEITGLLGNSDISLDDILTYQYDNAYTEIWRIDYNGIEIPRMMFAGRIGDITVKDAEYTFEVKTLMQLLQDNSLTDECAANCRFKFGDAVTCQVDLGPLTVTGSVTTLISQKVFSDSTRTEPDDYFDEGVLTWTSGNNNGRTCTVKIFQNSGGTFAVWLPPAKKIQLGDTYSLVPGCPHNPVGCKSFNNYDRYGGQNDVPGTDVIQRYPNAH